MGIGAGAQGHILQGHAQVEIRLHGEFQPGQHVQHYLLVPQQIAAHHDVAGRAVQVETHQVGLLAQGKGNIGVKAGVLGKQISLPGQVGLHPQQVHHVANALEQLLLLGGIGGGVHLKAEVYAQPVDVLLRASPQGQA